MLSQKAQAFLSQQTFRMLLILIFLMPTLTFFSRQSPSIVIFVAAVLAVSFRWLGAHWNAYVTRLKSLAASHNSILLVTFFLLACLSTLWSSAGLKWLPAILQTMSGIVTAILFLAAFEMDDTAVLEKVILAGLAFCSLIFIVDDFMAHQLRFNVGSHRNEFSSNRSAVLLALTTPFLLGLIFQKSRMSVIAALILIMITYSVAKSYSESAKLALLTSVIFFLLLHFFGKKLWNVMIGAIAVLIIFAPVIYGYIDTLMPRIVYQMTAFETVEIRARIWAVYSGLVTLKPIFGFGVGTSEIANTLPIIQAKVGPDSPYLKNVHPHAAALQIWFDLGLVGALIATSCVVSGFQKTQRLTGQSLCIIGSFIIAVFAVSSVSHGLWQAWWPCVIAYACLGVNHFPNSGHIQEHS